MPVVDPARLERMLQAAESDLQAVAGGASLCKVSATGTAGQSVKYFEGRWAALREIARGADPHAALHTWRVDFERHLEQGSGGHWLQYSAGGVDALQDLLGS